MTELQSRCLRFIADFIATKGYSPSYDEIGAHVGLTSKSQVNRLVYLLVEAGRLRMRPGGRRCLEVVEDGPSAESLADALLADLGVDFEDGDEPLVCCSREELIVSLRAALATTSGVRNQTKP